MPRARLFCRTGALAGAEHRIASEATIGRGAANSIVLPAAAVSQRHARIVADPAAGVYVLEDLESTNGTQLDGVPVAGPTRLRNLHVVTFAEHHDFIFVALPDAAAHDGTGPEATVLPAAAGPADPATRYEAPSVLEVPPLVAAPPAGGPEAAGAAPATRYEAPSALEVPPLHEATALRPAPRPAGTVIEIEIRAAGAAGRRLALDEGRHVVGRGADCAIRIDDPKLSRRHAAFVVRAGAVTVEDLRSTNGTFVGGRPVQAPAPVPAGEVVRFGDSVTAVVVAAGQA